ncbi:hypothetical protein LJB95_03305 [Paludibacteraceae bacterium OttesenSCG-928-F17]|nr:hypothetical protein [Paludibacteraceae bacterium OttesenSCG-928-F17]
MRKIVISSIILFASILLVNAQTTEFDAINFAQREINGTARYMGMAGAFGALGGDVSAVKDNPAGLGVFRRSELTTTFNFQNQNSKSTWDNNTAHDDLFKFGFSNFSYVMSFETYSGKNGYSGLQYSNFGFSYNRLKNFNRNVTVRNYDMNSSISDFIASYANNSGITPDNFLYNEDGSLFIDNEFFFNEDEGGGFPFLTILGYESGLINYNSNGKWRSFLSDGDLTSSSYYLTERGYVDEYSFSWGGNISNIVYLGVALNYTTISYSKSINYQESYISPNNSYMDSHISSSMRTWGNGFNANFGIIVRPFDQLRIGVSYLTPTLYSLRDDINNASIDRGDYPAPNTYYDYEIRVPGRFTGSLAYVIGQKAIISTDFNYTHYSNLKLYNDKGDSQDYVYENGVIKQKLKGGMTFKVGAEYRITNSFSVRAGFAAETVFMGKDMAREPLLNTVRMDTDYFIHDGKNYFTLGAGYKGRYWNFDLAFVNKNLHEKFAPYYHEDMNLASVVTRNYDIVATVGFRF